MPRACPVCGSRKWRKDAVTGNAVCEDGHVFQDFRSENLVVEATNFALQRRSLKRAPRKNKRKEAGNINRYYYHGIDAEYLKVQAMQLLQRYQVQALSRLWDLPDAFEIIVRDLWAYQLAISPLPPPPSAGTSRPATPPGDTRAHTVRTVDDKGEADEESENAEDTGKTDADADDMADTASAGSSKGDGADVDIDPEILAEISVNSSDEELLPVQHGEDEPPDLRKDSKWRRKRRLVMSDTIVTLVLALWVLRVPVMNVEMESLINDGKIPYLDFAHTTLVPPEMYKHMNRDTTLALCPSRAPRPMSLFSSVRKFARILIRQFGLTLPELNVHPVAWRALSAVGSTPTIYSEVMRLLHLLDVNISFTEQIETFLRRSRSRRPSYSRSEIDTDEEEEPVAMEMSAKETMVQYERTTRYGDVILPELAVMAAWVAVMKMGYGLDERPRAVLAKNDPVIGLPEGKRWVDELRSRLDTGALIGSRRHLQKQKFEAMGMPEIDRYLEQCEAVLLSRRDPSEPPDTAPFPRIPSDPVPPGVPAANSWADFHAARSLAHLTTYSGVPTDVPNKELPLMPGEKVRSYDASDATGLLPDQYEVVLRAAAAVVGVGPEDVGRVVERFERRLEMMRSGKDDRHGRNDRGSRSASRSASRSRSTSRSHGRSETRSRRRDVRHQLKARFSAAR